MKCVCFVIVNFGFGVCLGFRVSSLGLLFDALLSGLAVKVKGIPAPLTL
jgi:hypothetical protein